MLSMTAPDPAQRRLRATDLDRSMACTALDNAYADGELDFTEHQQRVDAAKQAKTLGDLAALLDDLQVAHALTGAVDRPAASTPTTRSRRWWVLPVAALVLALAVVIGLLARGHGGATRAAATRAVTPTSAPVIVRNTFTAAETQLLGILPADYGQNLCQHQKPDTPGEIASLRCLADADQGIPEATFSLFSDAESLQNSFAADGESERIPCASGVAGGSYSTDARSDAGQYQCRTAHAANGGDSVPSLEWTMPRRLVLGVVFADDPSGGAALLDWWRHHGQFR
jgi:hypothetical protein